VSDRFEAAAHVRWGDVDFNGHMRNTAFLDACGDARMQYFQSHGFSMARFTELRFGPVILRDELDYLRELKMLEPYTVGLELAGLAADGSAFRLCNTFVRADGKVAARVTSDGLWLDLDTRRPRLPPDDLAALQVALPRTDGFAELPSRVKPR
jgi:acyl-CoA thioester hydrolase